MDGDSLHHQALTPLVAVTGHQDHLLGLAPGNKQLRQVSGVLSDTQTINPTKIR